jgi:hypothetical protein
MPKKSADLSYTREVFSHIRSCVKSLPNSLTCETNLTPFSVFYNLLDSPFKRFGEFTDLALSIIGKVCLWVDLFGGGSWCLQTLMVSFLCAAHSFDNFFRTKKKTKEKSTLQTLFHLCVPKKYLAKPHFYYQLNISKTEL